LGGVHDAAAAMLLVIFTCLFAALMRSNRRRANSHSRSCRSRMGAMGGENLAGDGLGLLKAGGIEMFEGEGQCLIEGEG
jgi:hypothetical protein